MSNRVSQVVCFGEIMMRLTPPGYTRLVQAKSLEVTFGGAEANVAVALAYMGIDTSFVTRLPSNPIADACLGELMRFGVDTGKTVRGGERIGVYYLEKGASIRPSRVVYDRRNSSIAAAGPGDIDWEVLAGAGWLHVTGITPALSPTAAALTVEACTQAKARGVKVSCDLNYRQTLWTAGEAGETMSQVLPHVDMLVANEEHANLLFGIKACGDGLRLAEALTERFSLGQVVITQREGISASDNRWSALYFDGGRLYASKAYDIHIVDRIGAGDALAAGMLYSALMGYPPQEAIDFAVALSALKHTVEGDFCLISPQEAKALADGAGGGRVQR